jgi:hypothetical protein
MQPERLQISTPNQGIHAIGEHTWTNSKHDSRFR